MSSSALARGIDHFEPQSTYSEVPPDRELTGFVWLPLLFAALAAAAILLRLAGPVRYLYPLAATAISFFLYLRASVTYVKFVWWLWFLSPFVRRLVDFGAGWVEPNPILAAPLLATLACVACLFRDRSIWRRPAILPFSAAFLCVGYGFCIGIFYLPPGTLLVAALNWLAPLTFGLYMYSEFTNPQHAPAQQKALLQSFTWGLLLMGAYGVVQFAIAPAWDVMWLNETAATAFGLPEPFGIRVFSTMNSPVPFAVTLSVGLLLLMEQTQTPLVIVASVVGYASLLLSSVRAAWLGWAVGVVFFLIRKKQNSGRMLLAATLLAACLFAATAIEPVRDIVQTRLSTLTDIRDDYSFQSRISGYQDVLEYLSSSPLGLGLGSMDAAVAGKSAGGRQVNTGIGGRDSGILEILFSLGWAAGAVYLIALLRLTFCLLSNGRSQSPFAATTTGTSLAVIIQLLLGSATVGLPGVLLFGFAGISLGSRQTETRLNALSKAA